MTLSDLRERVSAASGADREIDALVHVALTGECLHDRTEQKYLRTDEAYYVTTVCADCGGTSPVEIPAYTTSLDAALALVEAKVGPDEAREIFKHAVRDWDFLSEPNATGFSELARLVIAALLSALEHKETTT